MITVLTIVLAVLLAITSSLLVVLILLHRGKGVCERERGLAIESSRLRDLRARVATWR